MINNLVAWLKSVFSSQLRRNIVTGTGAAAINTFLSFLSYPIYLHFLGYTKYGVWLALSTVLTFSQLGNLGISPAVSKFVAESYGSGDLGGVPRCLTTAWLATLVGGCTVVIVVVALRDRVLALFRPTGAEFHVMSSLLPYVAVFSVYIFIVEILNAALVGLNRADLESYYRTVSQSLGLITSAALLAGGFGVASLLAGGVLGYATMHLLSLMAVRNKVGAPLITMGGMSFSGLSRMLRFGGWIFSGSLVNMALHPLNRVIISRYAGVAALPLYEIAFGSSFRIRSLLDGGLRALMPEISKISAPITRDTMRRAADLERSGLRVIARFGAPLYVLLIVFAAPLLRVWLGRQFHPALPEVLRIMLIGSFLSLLCVPAYYILMGLGEARLCFVSAIIQSCVCFCLTGLAFLITGTVSVTSVSLSLLVGLGSCTAYIMLKLRQLAENSVVAASPAPPPGGFLSRSEAEPANRVTGATLQ